jgi:hypothetical protein
MEPITLAIIQEILAFHGPKLALVALYILAVFAATSWRASSSQRSLK